MLQKAAKELKLGLSVFKRLCRTLGLARWPYRTCRSLQGMMTRTHEYLAEVRTREHLTEIRMCSVDSSQPWSCCNVQSAGLSQATQIWHYGHTPCFTLSGMCKVGAICTGRYMLGWRIHPFTFRPGVKHLRIPQTSTVMQS